MKIQATMRTLVHTNIFKRILCKNHHGDMIAKHRHALEDNVRSFLVRPLQYLIPAVPQVMTADCIPRSEMQLGGTARKSKVAANPDFPTLVRMPSYAHSYQKIENENTRLTPS